MTTSDGDKTIEVRGPDAGAGGEPQPGKPIAVIDIGANSVRMVIAQVGADGKVEVLDRLERAVRLGHYTFVTGRLSREAINATIRILRDYRAVLDTYGAEVVRAVATSAVREASNAEAFLDRVTMAVNIDLELLDPAEESRLAVSAVREAIQEVLDVGRSHVLLVDVGGGSTLVTELNGGAIVNSQSLALGAVRLQEGLSAGPQPPARAASLLRHQIATAVAGVRRSVPMGEVHAFVAIGKEARTVARAIGLAVPSTGQVCTVDRKAFDSLVAACARQTPEKLAKTYGLALPDAERLVPGLLICQELLHATPVVRMIVCHMSMRDGLLLDLAQRAAGRGAVELAESIVQSAWSIARKYQADLDHAGHVAKLAVRLFDELQQEHGLSARHRVLLHVAAILHDTGRFVSNRAHHKHSHYVIANSEVFGLRRSEIGIAAMVARYHRRSPPKRTHAEYLALPRGDRVIVNKLAAILRIANALDAGHTQQVRDLSFARHGGDFAVSVGGNVDLTLERRALARVSDLFEDIYGLKVRAEEAGADNAERRAPPML